MNKRWGSITNVDFDIRKINVKNSRVIKHWEKYHNIFKDKVN